MLLHRVALCTRHRGRYYSGAHPSQGERERERDIRNAATSGIIKLNSITRLSRGRIISILYRRRFLLSRFYLLYFLPLYSLLSLFLPSSSFAANNPRPAKARSSELSKKKLPLSLSLFTREKFLESRREIKSPTATRVDDSASLMRE